jgi:hypothetical protein
MQHTNINYTLLENCEHLISLPILIGITFPNQLA